jgi:hypothetical protein
MREPLRRSGGALKAGARTMLDVPVDGHPRALSRGALAHAAGYEPAGGTFTTYLSTLRRNGLVDVAGDNVPAADVLFLAPSAPPASRTAARRTGL